MDILIGSAATIPVSTPTPVSAYSPLVMPVPGRAAELEMRVSFPAPGLSSTELPATRQALPILLLSHGHGQSNYLSSLHGYGPLADFYAAHGFVVIQPTHLDSKTLGLDPSGPEGALHWRSRAEDMHFILDHLEQIEAAVPGLSGRLDKSKIAAVGHSLGGHTVGLLSGMRVTDPLDGQEYNLSDSRITAKVMIAPPGGGSDLEAFASEHYPILRGTRFDEMTSPALVVAGDQDVSPGFFSARASWRADAYTLSPGPKCLLTIYGGQHILGGISGYDAAETSDENPERVAAVQRMTWAYLRSQLYPEDRAWDAAQAALANMPSPLGKVACK